MAVDSLVAAVLSLSSVPAASEVSPEFLRLLWLSFVPSSCLRCVRCRGKCWSRLGPKLEFGMKGRKEWKKGGREAKKERRMERRKRVNKEGRKEGVNF